MSDRISVFDGYGYAIADNESSSLHGNVIDVDAVLLEMQAVRDEMDTRAMSAMATAKLQGRAEMLDEVIAYLRRV